MNKPVENSCVPKGKRQFVSGLFIVKDIDLI
jgi:hypothetical protein